MAKKLILLAVAAVAVLAANAYDFMVDGIAYNLSYDGISVSVTKQLNNYPKPSYSNLRGAVIIPSSVSYNGNTYSVTSIESYAFYKCYNIDSVSIPNTVTTIGREAFCNCTGITSISFPFSVTTIGLGAFEYTNLISVTIPNSVSSIGSYAFQSNRSLSVTIVGKGSFSTSQMPCFYGASINSISIGSEITMLGGFLGLAVPYINCYAPLPPECSGNTFLSYDSEVHIPSTSTVAYVTAPYWQNFNNFNNDIIDKVTLSQSEAALIQHEEIQLVATATPNSSDLIWSSTNSNVAVVDNNGKVTATGQGECDIYATLATNPAVYASCHITANYPEITLALSDNEAEMNVGEELSLTATITPDNTGLMPTWSSSNESVAIVENGMVTAKGEGECDITATVLDKTATCHVVIIGNIIITLDQHEMELDLNHIAMLTPSCSPTETELTVTSSDPSVVFARMVTQNGTPKVQLVGMKQGVATVTVSSVDGKAIPDSCVVNVIRRVGDLNADGYINVTDITVLIDIIMGNVDEPDDTEMPYCDLNADSVINVMDITALIDIIMNS